MIYNLHLLYDALNSLVIHGPIFEIQSSHILTFRKRLYQYWQ